MALITAIGDNNMADAFAKSIAEMIVPVYPNHGWWIECKGGVLIIKHLEASGVRGLIGMLRKMDGLPSDTTALKREIVRAAGELLERANLARSGRTDDPVTSFEIDDKALRKYWHAPHRILH